MELHRTNYNSYEAKHFKEQFPHDSKHTVNFPEFLLA
jgi:hypothetical protein